MVQSQSLFPFSLSHLPLGIPSHPRHSLLDIEPLVRRPRRLELLLAHRAVHLLDAHQLLDLEDHTGELGVHRVEDGLHAAAQAQGRKDAACPLGEADGGSVEGDAEVGHCGSSCRWEEGGFVETVFGGEVRF